MARNLLSLYLLAAVSIALFDGFIECYEYTPSRIDIESPSQYQKLLEGLNRKHKFIYVEAGAHHDVLGEAKRWAYASIYQIRLSDEYGNVIILDPQGRRLSAQFTQGNLFAKLPNDYSSYTVTVTDDGVVTEADRRTIARWASAEHVKIVDANGVSVRLA